jgi:hypothetical protein
MTEPPALMTAPDEGVSGLWLWHGGPPDQQKHQSCGSPRPPLVEHQRRCHRRSAVSARRPCLDCGEIFRARRTLGLIPADGCDRHTDLAAPSGRHSKFSAARGRHACFASGCDQYTGVDSGCSHPTCFGARFGCHSCWDTHRTACPRSHGPAGSIDGSRLRSAGFVVTGIEARHGEVGDGRTP